MRFAPLSPVIPNLYICVYLYRYIYGPHGKSGAVAPKEVPKICNNHVFHSFHSCGSHLFFSFCTSAQKKNAGRLAVVFRWRVFWLFYLTLSALLFLQLLCTTFSNSHNTFFYLLIHVLILVEHLPNSFMYSSKFSDLSSLYFLPTKDAIFIKCLFFLTLWRRNMKPAQRTLLNS